MAWAAGALYGGILLVYLRLRRIVGRFRGVIHVGFGGLRWLLRGRFGLYRLALSGRQIALKDFSEQGTFVDEIRVNEGIELKLGQTIRIGTPGEHLQLIACIDAKTPK